MKINFPRHTKKIRNTVPFQDLGAYQHKWNASIFLKYLTFFCVYTTKPWETQWCKCRTSVSQELTIIEKMQLDAVVLSRRRRNGSPREEAQADSTKGSCYALPSWESLKRGLQCSSVLEFYAEVAEVKRKNSHPAPSCHSFVFIESHEPL